MLEGYLEGHGGSVSSLIMRIFKVATWIIGVFNLLTKSPLPFQVGVNASEELTRHRGFAESLPAKQC